MTCFAFRASTLTSTGTIGDNTYLTDFNILDSMITEQEVGYIYEPPTASYSYLVDNVALLNTSKELIRYVDDNAFSKEYSELLNPPVILTQAQVETLMINSAFSKEY